MKSNVGTRAVFFGSIVLFLLMAASTYFIDSNTQDVRTWLTSGSESRRLYDLFVERFGNDDVVLIGWEGCTTSDPRLTELENRLRDPNRNQDFIRSVVSGRTIVDQMVANGKSRRRATARLHRVFIGSDRETTCITVALSDKGHEDRRAAILQIKEIVDGYDELEWDELYLTGPAYVGVMIDQETNRSIWYVIPASLLGFLLTWIFVRRFRLIVAILFTSWLSSTTSLGVMVASGTKLNGLLILMPTLVAVLAVSGAIHLVHYFQDELREATWNEAVRRARRIAFRPCSLSVITTSIAISSLGMSNIMAVRVFGFYTAISLLFALGFILTVLPAWMMVLRPPAETENNRYFRQFRSARRIDPLWQNPILRVFGLLGFMLVALLMGWGLTQAESALDSERLFLPKSNVRRSLDWFSQNLTGRDAVEVMVMLDPEKTPKLVDELNAVWSVQRSLVVEDKVTASFSAVNFYGPVPQGFRIAQVTERQQIEKRLQENRANLERQRFRVVEEGKPVWRIRICLQTTDSSEYQPLVADFRDKIASDQGIHPAVETVQFSGMMYLASNSQQQLYSELFRSFSLAFLVITPVMMLVLRSFWAGLFAMIPNVAPTLVVFGTMGLVSYPVTIGAILTATVGLGIAVDDTLHFLCWYDRYVAEEKTNAIGKTVSKCMRPMIQTSVICGASLLAFAPAEFVPVRQFATTIAVLLALALFFDLIILPMMLASPIGFVFRRRKNS